MKKIEIRPDLFLCGVAAHPYSLARGVALLQAVQEKGNLRAACGKLDISYRTGWAALAEMEQMLGGAVVEMSRGRGTELTELGQRLVWAEKLIHARLDPLLESMAIEVDAEIQSVLARATDHLKIFASHDFAMALLGAQLQAQGIPLDLSYRGSLEAVGAMGRGMCDLAGFHIPTGALEPPALKQFEKLLQPSHVVVNLATRRQGLIVKRGNPKGIWSIADLAKPDVLFVNRQPGSGTRIILDLMLAQEGLTGQSINGFERVELTHAAIGAYVASGKADVGLGVETAARQFDLDFVPVIAERYFLLCDRRKLADARFKPIHDYLKTSEFRTEVSRLAGYDSASTGGVLALAEAFPSLALGKAD
ncbi:MAG: hypothetical protein H6R04_561 [Burkholderiaceae bacterium]|nr:hypothetical protein [Burkholderiaceae bacterium]